MTKEENRNYEAKIKNFKKELKRLITINDYPHLEDLLEVTYPSGEPRS